MSWQIVLALSILIASIQVLFARTILKEDQSSPVAYAIFTNFLSGVIIFILLIPFLRPPTVALPKVLLPILLSNFLYGVGVIFSFNALKLVEASEYIVLFATRVFWVILVSVFFFGDKFTLTQFLGTILILAGVYIVSLSQKKFNFKKGHIMILLAAPLFGTAFTIDGYILRTLDASLYVPISSCLTGIFAASIRPKEIFQIKYIFKGKLLGKLTLLSLLFGLSAFTYLLALQLSKNASQVASINQTSIILTVILGVIFLKERNHLLRKLFAAILSFVGVLLVK